MISFEVAEGFRVNRKDVGGTRLHVGGKNTQFGLLTDIIIK